jgi:glycosyltransferase involved in cell wall biosynthesis
MVSHIDPRWKRVTTKLMMYHDDTGIVVSIERETTGMWERKYLLEHPFNEKLTKGVDREYNQEYIKAGEYACIVPYYHGHYYRRHSDYMCAGDMTITGDVDCYILAGGGRSFIDPIGEEIRKKMPIHIGSAFQPELADKAKIIWVEWATKVAAEIADYECKAKKILRIHSYEAFGEAIKYIDFSKYNTVIFIAEHIKEYVERKHGKIPNAIVIPNGIETNRFTIKGKQNNKIAYAGQLSRKKGIGELFLVANSLPEYEFHCAGQFTEDDVAEYFHKKKPDNVFLHPYQYDLNKFFEDKTYIINTSVREGNPVGVLEGMSAGLKPLINNWIGAKEIYGEYVYKDLDELKKLLEGDYEPTNLKNYSKVITNQRNIENL